MGFGTEVRLESEIWALGLDGDGQKSSMGLWIGFLDQSGFEQMGDRVRVGLSWLEVWV